MLVAIRQITLRGEQKWQLDYRKDGKRYRPTFDTKGVAESERSQILTGRVSAKAAWAKLSEPNRDRLILAYHDALQQGHDLTQLLERAGELEPRKGPKLATVITELITAKRNAGKSDDYIKDGLTVVLNQFAKGRSTVLIDSIDVTDVESFLDSKKLASRSTLRARLSTLFKFAVRRGYRKDNPCTALEPITYDKPPPQVFNPKEFKTAVKWLLKNARHGLAWFALTTVCGLRPEEAEKTTKADINFKEGWIRVEKQTTKVRMRRVVYPKPEAMRFLKLAIKRGGELPIDPQCRQRMISGYHRKNNKRGKYRTEGLRDALGFTAWPKDITRHTAASYWLASGESTAQVSKALGNSERILERDYKALVTRVQAVEFWKVVLSCLKT